MLVHRLVILTITLFLCSACPTPEPKTSIKLAPKDKATANTPEKPKSVSFSLFGNLFPSNATKVSAAAQAIKDSISNEKISFTVLLGDSLTTLKNTEAEFFVQSLFVELPGTLYGALGDQEYGTHALKNMMLFERLFRSNRQGLPPPFPARAITAEEILQTNSDPLGRWYSIRAGVILLVVLDSEVTDDEGWQDQIDFLRKTLALAELPRTGVDIKHVFIALHRSPFSAYGKDELRVRDSLAPIWSASPKVRAVISAHSSAYERYVMTRTRDGVPLSDVLYTVVGTGGILASDPTKKSFVPDISYGAAGTPDGLLRLTSSGSYLDPVNGAPGVKKPIYGYVVISVSPEGNIEERFVPVQAEGNPKWSSDTCTYTNGYLRWDCKK
jgi:hypothetical protein